MITQLIAIILMVALIGLLLAVLRPALLKRSTHGLAVNVAEGTHGPTLSKRSDAAITSRYLLGKVGSDIGHTAVTAAVTDIPLGVIIDEASAAEEVVGVALLGVFPGTVKMVANAAITAGALVSVGAAGGKVATLPGAAGTYYIVGRALTAAGADGDVIEVQHCFPTQRVVE